MQTWREIKNTARRTVHDTMQVAAFYCVPNPAYVDEATTPNECVWFTQEVNPRVHYQFKALGDLKGTSFAYAEKQEVAPQLIFLIEELAEPMAGAIVSVGQTEMYQINNVLPTDGITVSVEVTKVPKRQMVGVPFPGD